MDYHIQTAQEADLPQIAEIWNYYITNSTNSFRSALYSIDEIRQIIADNFAQNTPFFVAKSDKKILGFAHYRQFRGGDGYRFSMEHSIYLLPDARKNGIGYKLYSELEEFARAHNVHSLTAAITTENLESIQFHKRLGFDYIGEMPEIGYKFNRFLSATILLKIL